MTFLKGFAIFIGLCLAKPAKAETKYTPKIIPKCQIVQILPGMKRCAYTLEQIKELYKIDSRCAFLEKASIAQGQKLILQSDIIAWQQEQLRLSAKNTSLFSERMNSLTKLYVKTDKKLQFELAKPRWGHYIAWGLTAAVTALLVGYITADQINK